MLDFLVLHDNMNIDGNNSGNETMKNSVGYMVYMGVVLIYALYAFWTYFDYSADEQAVLINEVAGSEVACTDWIVSYPGRIVVACEDK